MSSSSFSIAGQPGSTNPVWGQTGFSNAPVTAFPLAGSYVDQLRDFYSSIPSGLTGEDRMIYGLLGAQSIGAGETARQNKEMMNMWMQYQKEAAKEANEMGIRNQVIGSFLKDVPAAIAGAAARRTEFDPARVQIARESMLSSPAERSIPNYYSFVR